MSGVKQNDFRIITSNNVCNVRTTNILFLVRIVLVVVYQRIRKKHGQVTEKRKTIVLNKSSVIIIN